MGGESVAYPFLLLRELGAVGVVNDTVDGQGILVTFRERSGTARAFLRAVDGDVLTFSVDPGDPDRLVDAETGSRWTPEGLAVEGDLTGAQLETVDEAYVVFWFAWSIFNPSTRIGV